MHVHSTERGHQISVARMRVTVTRRVISTAWTRRPAVSERCAPSRSVTLHWTACTGARWVFGSETRTRFGTFLERLLLFTGKQCVQLSFKFKKKEKRKDKRETVPVSQRANERQSCSVYCLS